MRALTTGLCGLNLALAAATGAVAQTPPAAPDAAAPAPAAATPPAKPSVETTTIGDLLANPATKAVLVKDLPGLLTDERLPQAMGMSLRAIEPYSDGKIDDAKLAEIQKDFDALPPG